MRHQVCPHHHLVDISSKILTLLLTALSAWVTLLVMWRWSKPTQVSRSCFIFSNILKRLFLKNVLRCLLFLSVMSHLRREFSPSWSGSSCLTIKGQSLPGKTTRAEWQEKPESFFSPASIHVLFHDVFALTFSPADQISSRCIWRSPISRDTNTVLKVRGWVCCTSLEHSPDRLLMNKLH